ncbi:MAG: TspO/MBR family protein [Pseudomonadota bacterium]
MTGTSYSPRMTPYFVSAGVAIAVAIIGGLATDVGPWYRQLRKPWWNPPDWLFGPAWTLIYALCAYAAGKAWLTLEGADRFFLVLGPFLLNAFLNALWSVVFFATKRPDLALLEVGALWLSTALLCWSMLLEAPAAGLALVPYLLWVTFAGALNAKIVQLNGYLKRPAR